MEEPMTDSLRELLPCPFCGETACGTVGSVVGCASCDIWMTSKVWNRRALLAETPGEAGLRRDALALLVACELADEQGELADNIDGSLMDNLRDHFPDTYGIEGPLTFDELVKRAPPAPAKGEEWNGPYICKVCGRIDLTGSRVSTPDREGRMYHRHGTTWGECYGEYVPYERRATHAPDAPNRIDQLTKQYEALVKAIADGVALRPPAPIIIQATLAPDALRERVRCELEEYFSNHRHQLAFGDYEVMAQEVDSILDKAFAPAASEPADCLCRSWVGQPNPACPVHSSPPSDQGLRERLLHAIERYCGDADVGKGASKTWTQWKADFADQLIAALASKKDEEVGK
jgi:hypothetical protein